MPYKVTWYRVNRVILIELIGKVTLEEFERLSVESNTFVDNGIAPVHGIVDQTQLESVPHNLRMLWEGLNQHKRPNSGFTVMVSSNQMSRFLGNAILQMVGAEVRQAATVNEAFSILKRIDHTLLDAEK